MLLKMMRQTMIMIMIDGTLTLLAVMIVFLHAIIFTKPKYSQSSHHDPTEPEKKKKTKRDLIGMKCHSKLVPNSQKQKATLSAVDC